MFAGTCLERRWEIPTAQMVNDGPQVLCEPLAAIAAAACPVVIGSVVPATTDWLSIRLQSHCDDIYVFRNTDAIPLSVGYKNTAELGPDRIANAVAAAACYDTPVVVVDFGTAITFEVIDRKKCFIGGAIMPGVQLAFSSLLQETAMLSSVELCKTNEVIGQSMGAGINSGIYFGTLGGVREILERIAVELSEKPRVVATGGGAFWYQDAGVFSEYDLHLTLRGLCLIYQHRCEPG